MESYSTPRITGVERLVDGVIISFDDGKCALYSAFLLHAFFDQAAPLLDDSDESEE